MVLELWHRDIRVRKCPAFCGGFRSIGLCASVLLLFSHRKARVWNLSAMCNQETIPAMSLLLLTSALYYPSSLPNNISGGFHVPNTISGIANLFLMLLEVTWNICIH